MRLYRLLLYLYPASFRAEYGEQIAEVFSQRRQYTTNPLPILYLWAGEFVDTLANAARAHWDVLRQDLSYTVKTLARIPGFTLTAVLVTGLGIGTNTAAFSVVDRALLHPLSFAEPDRLVQLWQQMPEYYRLELSPPNFDDWRQASTSFEAMAAYVSSGATFLGKGEPQRLDGTRVTPEFFQILRVRPLIGRVFNENDIQDGAAQSIILSYSFWQSAFGGSVDILGKSLRLDADTCIVVGVMPPSFDFPARGRQFWRPLIVRDPGNYQRDNYYYSVIARLRSGVTLEQARTEMSGIAQRLALQYPKENDKIGAHLDFLQGLVPEQTRLLLWALFAASLCVLLITCANLANLLLAKAMARRKELVVRTAIGAGRERLIRQLLTESLVLSLAGGAAGLVFAVIVLPILSQLVPSTLPLAAITVLDRRVLAFAMLVTLATGLGFGVLPAFRLCRGVDFEGLREGSRSGLGGTRERMRSALVVFEISASVVLLVSAGLLMRALLRVQSIDPGFRPDSVLSTQIWLPSPRYSMATPRVSFFTEILSNVRTLPGVTNAGVISFLPMNGGGGIWPVAVPGYQGKPLTAAMRLVSSGYFSAMGTPLLAGRDISDSDTLKAPSVVIVSESFVKRYWPNENPIGHTFHFAMDFPFAAQDRTVVGVVKDVLFRGLERQSEPQVYLSYQQLPDNTSTFYVPKELIVRSTIDNAALGSSLRRIIHNADAEMPIAAIRPLKDVVDLQTAPRETQIRLVATFAGLSLFLAGIGIHGLLSYAVGQRKPEFGLRIALGAQRRDILSIVLREGLWLTAVGIFLGLILSYFVGRPMQALLAGIGAVDPLTLGVTVVVAFTMSLSGSLLPALRATRADPTAAIRGE